MIGTLFEARFVWLGQPDPLDTKAQLKADNPEQEDKAELMCALLQEYEIGARFTVRDIGLLPDDPRGTKALIASLLQDGRWDNKRAGHFLLRHIDVPFHGVVLRSRSTPAGARVYWMEGAPEAELLAVIDVKEEF